MPRNPILIIKAPIVPIRCGHFRGALEAPLRICLRFQEKGKERARERERIGKTKMSIYIYIYIIQIITDIYIFMYR